MATVSIIGSGNTATAFAKALFKAGHWIDAIIARQYEPAAALASTVRANAIVNNPATPINCNSDMVMICVNDDHIAAVAGQLRNYDGIVCHCSGTIPMTVLEPVAHHGVLYPLQTLSKEQEVNFLQVPILYEGSDTQSEQQLQALAATLSNKDVYASSETRLQYHLAAVWANNFSNLMVDIAYRICNTYKLDFNLLKPLILETAHKLQFIPPPQAQTGPAKRGDVQTMEKHLQLLQNDENLKALYQVLSKMIQGIS